DDRFFRVGRSSLVNLSCISRVTKTDIFFNNGESVPLPRGSYEKVNRAIIEFG
ncbi:MAG: LytTR family transcriptional regulator DNA-binding domain-containing protein, partial [Butyrivibrio sp.]|nr:LytTR family transcriptional regulator DNA-binding domain-containing protein [Butyrivibrio sp.]